jgi:ankyrin repeat protein
MSKLPKLKQWVTQKECPLIWKQGDTFSSTGSVLVILAQNGYTQEAHQIISLSRTASLIGRDSDGGLPELWDVMGRRKNKQGITRLMAICATSGSLSPQRARALIRDHNVDVKARDDKGRTALHYALGVRYSSDLWTNDVPISCNLLRVLLEAHPQFVFEKDERGYLPIHYVCEFKYSCDIINLFIASVDKKTLHLACANGASFDEISLLLKTYPQGAKEKDRNGNFALHSTFTKDDDGNSLPIDINIIKLLISANPSAVKEKNFDNSLPLNLACGSNASLDVIKLLMFKGAVEQADNDGRLPLLSACMSGCSLKIIKFLYKEYPAAMSVISEIYGMPLHNACFYNSYDVVEFLINAYPQSVRLNENLSDLPLHFACRRPKKKEESYEIITRLLHEYPESLKEKNGDKELPIHKACQSNAPFSVIKHLLDLYPESVSMKGGTMYGRECFPLYYACKANAPLEVISLLVSLYPHAVKVKEVDYDEKSLRLVEYLPIHLALRNNASIEIIKLLYNSYPECLKQEIDSKLALHLACDTASIDVINFIYTEYPQARNHRDRSEQTPADYFLTRHLHEEKVRLSR